MSLSTIKRIAGSILLLVVLLIVALVPPASAQQPQPPVPPNQVVLDSRWINVTKQMPNWTSNKAIQLLGNKGYWLEQRPQLVNGQWFVIMCKWITRVSPVVVMVPAPAFGGATYCKVYPRAPECTRRKQ
jgi:hypothetical protein